MIPPRVHWFARHGKQATPGKTSAKATLVSGDTVDGVLQMQIELGSFSMGVKLTSSWVFVCTHWVAERKNLEWVRPKFVWALPAWPLCPFLPGLGRCPRWLLTSWVLLFYLLLEKNSLSLWVCCGFNKLPCFSQFWNVTKSNRVGRWLLPGKGATSLERNGGEKQLNLCTGSTAVCAPW